MALLFGCLLYTSPALQAHLRLAAEQAAHARGRALLPAQDELDLQGKVLALSLIHI